MTTTYRVTWEIDVDADSPEAAAVEAQLLQQTSREDYWCGVFEVVALGDPIRVDLNSAGILTNT